MNNRSELRKKIMTILYQINIYEQNKIEYDVHSVIKEVSEIDNEFIKDIVYGIITYKNDIDKVGTIKYSYMLEKLSELDRVDENHGILSLDLIKNKCTEIFKEYDIEYAYLFGSYAKDKAKDDSDVDLLISSTVKGIKFYGLVERISQSLKKKVDLLDSDQLVDNPELLNEILKDGIKIYLC